MMETLLWILATVAIAAIFYYFIVKPFNYWKEKGVPQSNRKWIVGDNWGTLTMQQNLADFVNVVYDRFPNTRYTGMYQFFIPTLLIKDPDLLKQITVKDFDHFTDHRSIVPEDVDPLLGKNLFSLKGQKWKNMRAILSPSFTSSKMKSMFALMEDCSRNFVQHFLKTDQDVTTIEFKDTFTRFTNDVIATTAFGIKVNSLEDQENEFFMMGKDATNVNTFWRTLKFLGYFLVPKLYKVFNIKLFPESVSKFFKTIIFETIRVREEKGIVRQDMINLLIEARKGVQKQEENGIVDTGFSTAEDINMGKTKVPQDLTDLDIAAQAMIFFFAGFDTVSGLMCFLAYELTVNPDIQERLREEVRTTLEECEGKLTYEGLLKMKYMDMVVSEALRKWPNAVAVDRVCTKPYTIQPVTPEENPVHLEKGTVLLLPIFSVHRDPKHYPDPERFDPERFNDENKDKIKPYTFFPFGLGPRNCIGSRFALLETKVVIFHILNNFELVPVEKSRIPMKLSKKKLNLTPEDGFWFGLKRLKA